MDFSAETLSKICGFAYEDELDKIRTEVQKQQEMRTYISSLGVATDTASLFDIFSNPEKLEEIAKRVRMKAFW